MDIRNVSHACFDTCSVNFGEHAGVVKRLLDANQTIMAPKCTSHSLALAAKHVAQGGAPSAPSTALQYAHELGGEMRIELREMLRRDELRALEVAQCVHTRPVLSVPYWSSCTGRHVLVVLVLVAMCQVLVFKQE